MLRGFFFKLIVRDFVSSLDGMARRGDGKHTKAVSMEISLSSSRSVLAYVKRQLSLTHPPCCTNEHEV